MEVRQERERRDGTCHSTAFEISGLHGPRSLRCGGVLRNGSVAKSATTSQRGNVQGQWIIASLDINMAFLNGPIGNLLKQPVETIVWFERYAASRHRLQCFKPGAGTKDVPRAPSLKLRKTTRGFGLQPTPYEDIETSSNLLTAKHVDDINLAGAEDKIGKH
eukprot:8931706-Pyramimonas_sp.AAC.1